MRLLEEYACHNRTVPLCFWTSPCVFGDRFGNVTKETDALGNSKEATYNLYGNPITITDKNGNTFTSQYNEYGSLLNTRKGGVVYVQKNNAYNVYNMETVCADNTTGTMYPTSTTYDVYGYPNLKVNMRQGYRVDYVNDVDGNIASEINSKVNPLYGKVSEGDVIVTIYKDESWTLKLYFDADNKEKCYYVKEN